MKIKLVPYKVGSHSATQLRNAIRELGYSCHIVARDSATYRPRNSHLIVNWGCTTSPTFNRDFDVNLDVYTNRAANKLTAFETFKLANINTPEWTTDQNVCTEWLAKGDLVVCRTILNGTNGNGIILAENPEQLVPAPLYTRYKKKKSEFRVHVFNRTIIDVQQKKKRMGQETNPKIRNVANGWVFCRENIVLPQDAEDLCQRTLDALGLTFGAVDLIFNEKENSSFILEVNTAPGLEGQTIQSYATAITRFLENAH